MAKQAGMIKVRGKIGNVVGFKTAKGIDALRERVTSVNNPKTTAQAYQRMKIAPAANFYRQLSAILDHSFQGIKYGALSHAEFNRGALLLNDGYPFVDKGDKTPWPGEYVIASGSLAPVSLQVSPSEDPLAILLPMAGGTLITENSTIADLTAHLNQLPGVQDGDQLTFIFCWEDDDLYFPIYKYGRVVLDSNNTALLSAVESEQGIKFESTEAPEEGLKIRAAANSSSNLIAGAVIVSRPPKSNGGAWQRSFTKMVCTDEFKARYMSAARKVAAMESYKNRVVSNGSNSEYYLNQGNDPGNTSGVVSRSIVAGAFTIGGQTFDDIMSLQQGSDVRLVVSEILADDSTSSASIYHYDPQTQEYTVAGSFTGAQIYAATGENGNAETCIALTTVKGYFPDITLGETAETEP